jgi:hypothetical protein
MATASPVTQRAKKAAWISLFTFGFGGLFWAGHWFYGLMYAGFMLFAFVTIFFGIGLIVFPMLWLFGPAMTYAVVKQTAMQNVLLRQADETELRDKLAGGNV